MYRLLIIAILLLSSSCQRFTNRYDHVTWLCAIDPKELANDERLIKIDGPNGEELTGKGLRSRLLFADGSIEEISLSSKGCLRLRNNEAVLQVLALEQGWHLSQRLDPATSRLLHLQLQKSPDIRVDFTCPAQGLYASERIAFPLKWTSDSPLNAARIELLAENESSRQTHKVFSKGYGEHLDAFPNELATRDLPEGLYRLRLAFHMSSDAWDQPGLLAVESCPLTVLHGRPTLSGLNALALDDRLAVYGQGQVLPWRATSDTEQLFVCKEERSASANEASPHCEARARCRDPGNFRNVSAVVADEVGIFDTFVFAEDRAGNRSDIYCQTTIVQPTQAELDLRWTKEEWNQPSAIMEEPQHDIELRVNGSLPGVVGSSVWQSMECKADFVRADQSIVTGRNIVCQGQKCQGRSLEDYVPCDTNISLSLGAFWGSVAREGGFLRVHVRAQDRAASVQEETASLAILPQRWSPTRLTATAMLDDTALHLEQDGEGRIYTTRGNELLVWNESRAIWDPLPRPTEAGTVSIDIWTSGSRTLILQSRSLDRQGTELWTFWERRGQDWAVLPSLEQACQQPKVLRHEGFSCIVEGGLAVFSEGRWRLMPFTDLMKAALSEHLSLREEMGSSDLSFAIGSDIYQWKNGTWEKKENGDKPVIALGTDEVGELWILRGTSPDDLSLRRNGQETRTPGFPWFDVRTRDLLFRESGPVIFGPYLWTPETKGWTRLPYFASRGFDQRIVPALSLDGELIWEYDQGFLIWNGQSLLNWDFRNLGLQPTAMNLRLAKDKTGAPIFLAEDASGGYVFPYRIGESDFSLFPPPQPNASMSQIWLDEGRLSAYVPGVGYYELMDDGWKLRIKSPMVGELGVVETESFEPYIVTQRAIYRYAEGPSWATIAHFPMDEFFYGGSKDASGRIWVYNGNQAEIAVIGERLERQLLPAELGTEIKGLFALGADLWIATDKGLVRERDRQLISWPSLGFDTVDRIRKIDETELIVSAADPSSGLIRAWIVDPFAGGRTEFALPQSMLSLGNIRKTKQGDFIFAIGFEIYRGDGRTFRRILSKEQLYSLASLPGSYLSIHDLRVDPADRVWINVGHALLLMKGN